MGEHPTSDANYIAETIKAIYDVKVKTKNGHGQIRRVNINASPISVSDLKMLREAGIDDVAIGALFGLYDWRFDVMGLLSHARELEKRFDGIGPHTVSFPHLEPAAGTPFIQESKKHRVSNRDFKRLVAIIRLSIPYTGMIITARERTDIRRDVIPVGCTQTDTSARIGIGAYSDRYTEQEEERQQFILGDTRSLDEVIREFAEKSKRGNPQGEENCLFSQR
jgi:2-iminoacetate synthase